MPEEMETQKGPEPVLSRQLARCKAHTEIWTLGSAVQPPLGWRFLKNDFFIQLGIIQSSCFSSLDLQRRKNKGLGIWLRCRMLACHEKKPWVGSPELQNKHKQNKQQNKKLFYIWIYGFKLSKNFFEARFNYVAQPVSDVRSVCLSVLMLGYLPMQWGPVLK